MSTISERTNALEDLSSTLSKASLLLENIPTVESFSKVDRQNAVAILARIFPEQLRAPAHSVVNDRTRGGAEDDGCFGVTPERKYYEFNSVFIRRTLEPHELMYNIRNELVVPHIIKERMMNDVAAIEFVRQNTSIPLPKVLAAFHDNGRYYIIQERVPGVQLAELAWSQIQDDGRSFRPRLSPGSCCRVGQKNGLEVQGIGVGRIRFLPQRSQPIQHPC